MLSPHNLSFYRNTVTSPIRRTFPIEEKMQQRTGGLWWISKCKSISPTLGLSVGTIFKLACQTFMWWHEIQDYPRTDLIVGVDRFTAMPLFSPIAQFFLPWKYASLFTTLSYRVIFSLMNHIIIHEFFFNILCVQRLIKYINLKCIMQHYPL